MSGPVGSRRPPTTSAASAADPELFCIVALHPRISICSAVSEESSGGLQQDVKIQRQRPVLHVERVRAERLLRRNIVASVDLPPTGEAGSHFFTLEEHVSFSHVVDLISWQGPRTDQAHLPDQDVPQLRPFIDAES